MTDTTEIEAKLDAVTALIDQLFGDVAQCIIVGLPDGMVHYTHNLPAGVMADLLRSTADREDDRPDKAGEEKDDLNGVGGRDRIG